jgi:hypothetical protein
MYNVQYILSMNVRAEFATFMILKKYEQHPQGQKADLISRPSKTAAKTFFSS